MPEILCPVSAIPEPGSRAFTLTVNGKELAIFVVHKDGSFYAYLNRCPHTGINLEWQPDQFLDIEQRYIQCAMHGALFEIETGDCIHGPCAGEHLQPISIRRDGNSLIIEDAETARVLTDAR